MSSRNNPAKVPKLSKRKRTLVEVVFIAVDATPLRWAMWPMVDGKVVISDCKEGSFEKPTTIDVAEAWCLHEGTVYARERDAKVWVFANDNQGVGRSYTHGFSRCHGVHSVIKLSAIDPEQAVVMADVPTTVNVSDIGTRPAKDYTPIEVEFPEEGNVGVLAKGIHDVEARR